MTAVRFLFRRHASLDELVCDARGKGLGLSVCQLDTQLCAASMAMLQSPHVRLSRFEVGNRTHHLLAPEPGYLTFGLLTREQAPTCSGNREFRHDQMLLVDPDTGLDAVLRGGFSGYTFSIRQDFLDQVAARHARLHGSELAVSVGPPRALSPQLQQAIRICAHRALAQAGSGENPAGVQQVLEQALPALLLRGWKNNEDLAERPFPASSRSRVRERALEYLRSLGPEACSVEQLCLASASSYSTLERAFRDYFGLSPKRYITQSALSGVRQALIEEGSDRTVTEIALEWGFNHMGKFSAEYRRQFGELPSKTARPG